MTGGRLAAVLFVGVAVATGCNLDRPGDIAPMGARAGWMGFGGFEYATHDARPYAGFYLRPVIRFPSFVELELGAAPDAAGSGSLTVARASVCVAAQGPARWYGALGGGALYETYGRDDYLGGFVEAGVGVALPTPGGELDLRAAYQAWLGSTNVQRSVLVAVGFGF